MRRTTAALLSTPVVVLLAACGAEGDDDPASARATSGTSTSQLPTSGDPSTKAPSEGGPTFPDDTAVQTAENSGEWDLVLTDVRVAEHERFDRIVLEFAGTGTPGWAVSYVDEAVLDGSGDAVTLDGDSTLDIYASGTTYPGSEEDSYDGPRQFAPVNGGSITDMYVGGTFEGYTQVLAGIDGDAVPFRVFALTEPARLVVDVSAD